jgi:hypothetical protein
MGEQETAIDRELVAFAAWLKRTGNDARPLRVSIACVALRALLVSLRLDWTDAYAAAPEPLRVYLWLFGRYMTAHAVDTIFRGYARSFAEATKDTPPLAYAKEPPASGKRPIGRPRKLRPAPELPPL